MFFLYGFFKGIISELFAIGGFITGFIIAIKFSFLIQPYLLPLVKRETVALILGFLILFLLTAGGIIIVGIFFKKAIRFVRLSWLDRWIGGAVGLIKGFIIVGLISLLVVTFLPGGKAFIRQSKLGRHTITLVRIAVYLLPDPLRKRIEKSGTRRSVQLSASIHSENV